MKNEDDAIPLPDPLPLPKRYHADVEVALASGKMTMETMLAFLSAVAAAMLVLPEVWYKSIASWLHQQEPHM